MLQVKGLSKKYGSFLALDHIDLELEEGNIFGFVGPNGAGKTTTMRILATLMPATEGDAFIDGKSVKNEPKEVRKRIGYMPDFFGVYDNLKVSEYLDFYGEAAGMSAKQCAKTADELLELVFLSDKKESYVDSLSRGMKQRLCLARALMHSPELLILDEPASGMDPRARIEMKGILKTLKAMKKTVLISSHILPELEELCDIVGIIEQGKFLFVGSMEEIQNKSQGVVKIIINVNDDKDGLAKFLQEQPGVNKINIDEERLIVDFIGDSQEQQLLLNTLIINKFPVYGFMAEKGGLENAFLEVSSYED